MGVERHWRRLDPLTRFEAHLRSRDLLDDELEAELAERLDTEAIRIRSAVSWREDVEPSELLEHVYVTQPRELARECAELLGGLGGPRSG